MEKNTLQGDESKGWISLYRKIQENELYPTKESRAFTRLEAWIDLLLIANHSEKKVYLKNEIYICKRGQSLRTLETLSKRWLWPRSTVHRFLVLLENDGMIKLKTDTKATQITICNYDTYQGERNTDETRMKHGRNTDETRTDINNNVNNDNNVNNGNKVEAKATIFHEEVFTDEFIEQYGEKMLKAFFDYWSEPNRSNTKMKMELQQTWKLSGRLATWKSRETSSKNQGIDSDRLYRE